MSKRLRRVRAQTSLWPWRKALQAAHGRCPPRKLKQSQQELCLMVASSKMLMTSQTCVVRRSFEGVQLANNANTTS